MAGLGFKDFQVGEVLTSADVDGYLMQQSVMRFADAGARGSALGTAVGTAVPLAEGMVAYLDDLNIVQVYSGSQWIGVGGFNARAVITATNASWPVPTLANPVVKVTVIAGGGGGGGTGAAASDGGTGGTTTFDAGGGVSASASGGDGGKHGNFVGSNPVATLGFSAGNGGGAATDVNTTGTNGAGGEIRVAYLDLTGKSTVNVTVGAGGGAGGGVVAGQAGGRGEVIVEYVAG